MLSFFDKTYQSPTWFTQKASRRAFLKSAAGATAIAAAPKGLLANTMAIDTNKMMTTEPWLTLHAVLNHLLPASDSGPSAQDINALPYLYQVVTVQPIDEQEKQFIKNGVNWLNDYSQQQLKLNFVALSTGQKESTLRAISQSRAGENWLATILSYLLEAMLSPPVYGGNPQGIGWQWLEHQPGFPLPGVGSRYYELPGPYGIAISNVQINGVTKS